MKYFGALFLGCIIALSASEYAVAAVGTIDPHGTGNARALFLDSGAISETAINTGRFTTQSAYNATVHDTELRGYMWSEGAGWIVLNCADTTSGCSSANDHFKVSNDGTGVLSGYAWGENTGWIFFGPFSNPGAVQIKIGADGLFAGVTGTSGYAWSENFGWIQFDCGVVGACTETDWSRNETTTGGRTTYGYMPRTIGGMVEPEQVVGALPKPAPALSVPSPAEPLAEVFTDAVVSWRDTIVHFVTPKSLIPLFILLMSVYLIFRKRKEVIVQHVRKQNRKR